MKRILVITIILIMLLTSFTYAFNLPTVEGKPYYLVIDDGTSKYVYYSNKPLKIYLKYGTYYANPSNENETVDIDTYAESFDGTFYLYSTMTGITYLSKSKVIDINYLVETNYDLYMLDLGTTDNDGSIIMESPKTPIYDAEIPFTEGIKLGFPMVDGFKDTASYYSIRLLFKIPKTKIDNLSNLVIGENGDTTKDPSLPDNSSNLTRNEWIDMGTYWYGIIEYSYPWAIGVQNFNFYVQDKITGDILYELPHTAERLEFIDTDGDGIDDNTGWSEGKYTPPSVEYNGLTGFLEGITDLVSEVGILPKIMEDILPWMPWQITSMLIGSIGLMIVLKVAKR